MKSTPSKEEIAQVRAKAAELSQAARDDVVEEGPSSPTRAKPPQSNTSPMRPDFRANIMIEKGKSPSPKKERKQQQRNIEQKDRTPKKLTSSDNRKGNMVISQRTMTYFERPPALVNSAALKQTKKF